MVRAVAVVVGLALAACGRIAFDPIGDGGATATSDAALSAAAQGAYVKASNTGMGDQFGTSVALSADGSTLAVGAMFEASNATGIDGDQANDAAAQSGAVYVFTRAGASWNQQTYVKPSNTTLGWRFGRSIALSADGATLAVGADGETGAAGAAYVFTRAGITWSQQALVKASNPNTGDFFGSSVALSADGSTLAVGADGEASNATGINGNQADNSAMYAGAAYVFTRSGTAWNQQAYVKASDSSAGAAFGNSVALSADGSTLAVGAQAKSGAVFQAGGAYVFTRSGTTWTEQASIEPSNQGGEFGWRLALSADGSTLAVAAQLEASAATGIDGDLADTSATQAGAVYVLARTGTTWTQQAYVKASNTAAIDRFGTSVALSGDGSTLVVGASLEDSAATGINGNQADDSVMDAGAAYLFIRAGLVWTQRSYIKASNPGANDAFGTSVALSTDGSTLAVAAPKEASATTGIDGNQADNASSMSGAVYLFE